MARYGTDRPDLRFGLELQDVTGASGTPGFGVFRSVAESGGIVKGIKVPGAALVAPGGRPADRAGPHLRGQGLSTPGRRRGCAAPSGTSGTTFMAALKERFEVAEGDLIALVADRPAVANEASIACATTSGRACLADPGVLSFCWVVDFPLLERDEERDGDHPQPLLRPQGRRPAPPLDTDPGAGLPPSSTT